MSDKFEAERQAYLAHINHIKSELKAKNELLMGCMEKLGEGAEIETSSGKFILCSNEHNDDGKAPVLTKRQYR